MDPGFGKAIVLVGSIAIVVIPHRQHGNRGSERKVVKSREGPLEIILLVLVSLGFLLPLIWVATPVLGFADYQLRPIPFIAGLVCLVVGLWVFYRSHADLAANWSIALELREHHQLVTQGVYRRVRHPMYLSLLLYALGQGLVLPNWLAGPWYGIAVALLVAHRVAPEERMMAEEFGQDYKAYMTRTKRLIPDIW